MNSILDSLHNIASNVGLYGVTFILVLSLLVFVHEWGHYIVARLCGVRVETFSIGFGREIWGFNDNHGTRWKLSLIPLGGYVKMFGDTDPASAGHLDATELSSDERGVAFFAKKVWQRALVVFAGPGINFLFAILILATLYMVVGKPLTPPQAMGVEVGSAADIAGFKPHDTVLSINGMEIDSFDQIRRQVMIALDTPMQFKVRRGSQEITLTPTPKKVLEKDRFGFEHELGFLGLIGPGQGLDVKSVREINGVKASDNVDEVRKALLSGMGKDLTLQMAGSKDDGRIRVQPPAEMNKHLRDKDSADYDALVLGLRPGDETDRMGFFRAVGSATLETGRIIVDTLKAIGQMVTGTRSASELGGIIRIGALAGDMAERGIVALATFTALLSINLGLINLFPIPMLDGGHLTFYAIEAVRGAPLSEKIQENAFRFGLVVLVCLMVFANLNDIIQLIL